MGIGEKSLLCNDVIIQFLMFFILEQVSFFFVFHRIRCCCFLILDKLFLPGLEWS
jgi:hypothetical protein